MVSPKLLQITSNYFVAGLVLKKGHGTRVEVTYVVTYVVTYAVARAAPILSYMHGWSEARVISYVNQKHWEFQYVSPIE